MYGSYSVTLRKGFAALGMAVVLLLASGKVARAQGGPWDTFSQAVSNVGAAYDPTTHSPADWASNVLATPVMAAGLVVTGAAAIGASAVNVANGRDPNAPPGQTYSTLSNSPSSPSTSMPPSRNGPRLGTSAPGKPLTPSQQAQIAQQPLATKPSLLGNLRRPQAVNNSPPLGTSAPGKPLTPSQQHPIVQPSSSQHPTLLGTIRPPSQKPHPVQLASAKPGFNNHFTPAHHHSSGHHHSGHNHSGHNHKGHAGHPHGHR